jgi:prophage regulatory protein
MTQERAMAMWRLKRVVDTLGISRSSVYAHIASRELPPPVRVGTRASAWPSWEIEKTIDAQVAGCTQDDIRALVCRLVAERRSLCPDQRSDQ